MKRKVGGSFSQNFKFFHRK
ncbi:unnamed protein product [Ceutorhynchus assimilis]|uniref:Uncharacterized protein n=1 Tax=Ceutorhynchus assimilis TaxID=467358 RepID=A0A9N9N263_9CUCU|nr:unnamed protein product [Ceutorhynchus assimilis]